MRGVRRRGDEQNEDEGIALACSLLVGDKKQVGFQGNVSRAM